MNPINPTVDGKHICNTIYRGPKDLLTSSGVGCADLPTYVMNNEIISFWKPTAEELKALMKGQVVALSIVGGQPPCSLWVTDSVD